MQISGDCRNEKKKKRRTGLVRSEGRGLRREDDERPDGGETKKTGDGMFAACEMLTERMCN